MLHRKTLRIIYLKSFCIFMKILHNTYIKITESLITLPYVFKTNCFTHRKAVNKFGWEIHFWEWGQLLIYAGPAYHNSSLTEWSPCNQRSKFKPKPSSLYIVGFCLGEWSIIMGHLMGNHKGLACQLKERQAISRVIKLALSHGI